MITVANVRDDIMTADVWDNNMIKDIRAVCVRYDNTVTDLGMVPFQICCVIV